MHLLIQTSMEGDVSQGPAIGYRDRASGLRRNIRFIEKPQIMDVFDRCGVCFLCGALRTGDPSVRDVGNGRGTIIGLDIHTDQQEPITPGGCIISADQGQIDAWLETQIERIADELIIKQQNKE